MNDRPTRRVRGVVDSCDCGDGYGCSHGPWVSHLELDEPQPWWVESVAKSGEKLPDTAFWYSEVSEFPTWLTTLLLLGPNLAESLKRCVESLDDFVRCSDDPGVEALGALDEAKRLLTQLDTDPVTIAWGVS